MRKLLYVTLGFTAASGLCAYLLQRELLQTVTIGAGILALFCAVIARGSRTLQRAALLFLGCALGCFWFAQYDAHYLSHATAMDAQTHTVTILALDYSEETAYGVAFDGTIAINGKTYQVRTYLDTTTPVHPGEEVAGPFRFRVTTPDGAEASTYHHGKGIFLLAYQADEVVITQAPPSWQTYPAILRSRIKAILEAAFPLDTYPFAKALLLGDSSDLSYETDTDFKLSGIRHVIAVSGLHISILFTLIRAVTLKKRFLTAILGFPALFLFAAIAGFTPSVSRACLMSRLMLLGQLCRQEYDGPTALSFAVLVMQLLNPLVVTSVSLQLSAASVAGIFLFDPSIRKWLVSRLGDGKQKRGKAFFIRWFTTSVSISLSAQILTVPLSAVYFGTVSLIGVVTNLLTLWIISGVFYGILGVCVVWLISSTGAGFLAKLISIPIRYVLLLAKTMADVPLAAVYTRSPYITAWLIFVYGLLAAFLLLQNKKPRVFACCASLGLCMALLASWAEPMLSDVRFTVLDVGQGQCLLLQGEGRTYMIDCGGDSDTKTANIAAETLLSQGITKLDGLILTHMDRDHAGAAANFLSRIHTDLVILPPSAVEFAGKAGNVVYARKNLTLTFGDTVITIFVPTFPGKDNENSLCILFDTKKCVILVTGDRNGFGERSLLRNAAIPDVDILVAGHHGSANSTCEELLAAVRPEIVCISVAADNSYGHPAPELLQRLRNFGCTVYRTDQHGTILIRR